MKVKNARIKYRYLLLLLLWSVSCRAGSLEPLNVDDIEYPEDEPPSAEEVELGKQLFFDPLLSINKNQSCATCHNPDLGFGDGLVVSLSSNGEPLERNTPHLYNLAWNVVFFWDGRASSLEEQALGPIQSQAEMGMPLGLMIERLSANAKYKALFKQIYKSPKITPELVGRAIASFERSIISADSPYDKYLSGNTNAMSPSAVKGLDIFKGKARCSQCHDGANFTDNSFHNIGLNSDDPGRAGVVKEKSLQGAFKTPGLRNTLLTAPYMHDGSLGTLEDVVRFYNRGGDQNEGKSKEIKVLKLSEQEIVDLIAFLGALTSYVDIEHPKIP